MNYAVVFTYSFDNEVSVYLFGEETEAVKFLRDIYENELKINIEENGWDSVGEISEDGWYAKIETSVPSGVDKMEIRVGSVYQ